MEPDPKAGLWKLLRTGFQWSRAFFGCPGPLRIGAACSCGPNLLSCFPFFLVTKVLQILSSSTLPQAGGLLLFRNLFDFLPAGGHPAFGVLFLGLPPDCILFLSFAPSGTSSGLVSRASIQALGYLLLPRPGCFSLMVSPVSSLCLSCCLPTPSHTVFLPPPGEEPSSLFHMWQCPGAWDADFPVISFSLSATHHRCSPT